MSSPVYTDSLLDAMRQQADPVADSVITRLYQEGDRSLFAMLGAMPPANGAPLPDTLPPYLTEFFDATAHLPEWYDKRKVSKAAAFFKRNMPDLLSMLGFISLPYCYAAADGAQVLYLTERIRNNTVKRLSETAQYVYYVMQKDAFEPEGYGIRSAQLVRLTHAVARYHTLRSGKWNHAWGVPVNQEDMAGTNLAFSLISLRGLRKINIIPTPDEAEAFIHSCNVAAFFLGLDPALIPGNAQEAYQLDRKIASRHFKPSEAGRELTKALLNSFEETIPDERLRNLIPGYIRYLIGNEVADIIGLPPKEVNPLLLSPLIAVNSLRTLTGAGGSPDQFTDMFLTNLRRENGTTPFKVFFDKSA
jgi:hypothetical protein